MILRPCVTRAAKPPQTIPAWDAVLCTQREYAEHYLLVTQDDHARLAGELAAAFKSSWLTELSDEIVEAIAMHDCGWRELDEEQLASVRDGERPRSFLDMSVPHFLAAWTKSIERTSERTPVGGAVVSVHFSRLAEYRLGLHQDAPDGTRALSRFVEDESERRRRLVAPCGVSPIPFFVDALQLCDLASLYLCCGAEAAVEFPQFDRKLKISRQANKFLIDPPAVGTDLKLAVPVTCWPVTDTGAPEVQFTLESR